jgi:hypothetical protein
MPNKRREIIAAMPSFLDPAHFVILQHWRKPAR